MRLGWQRKLVGSAGPEPFGFRLVIVRDQLACSCTSVPAHLFAMCVRTKGCAFDFSLSLSLSLLSILSVCPRVSVDLVRSRALDVRLFIEGPSSLNDQSPSAYRRIGHRPWVLLPCLPLLRIGSFPLCGGKLPCIAPQGKPSDRGGSPSCVAHKGLVARRDLPSSVAYTATSFCRRPLTPQQWSLRRCELLSLDRWEG